MKKMVFLFFFTGFSVNIIATVSKAEILSPKTVIISNEGVTALKENQPYKAQEKFIKALEENPYSPEIHLNLAFSFFKQGQMDKARSEYETAMKLAKGTPSQANVDFIVNHNLGTVAHLEKKVEMALEFYQKALDLNPNSKETKINIELLLNENKQGGGEGDKKDDQQQQKKDEDKKDQQPDQKNQENQKDEKDQKKDGKEYSKNKPPPPKFKSEELTEGDVKKILGELRQQEQKIRAEFNKKETKEKPNEKDW